MKETISIKLFHALQKGKALLSKEALHRVTRFVESQRTEEDSFMNKNGKPDLYYTVFGWTLSALLNIRLDHDKTGSYLSRQQADRLDLIHYAAYMRCQLIRKMIHGGKIGFLFQSFFTTDIRKLDTFSGVPHNDLYAPYTQFIWLSLLEDTGHKIRNRKEVIDSLLPYRVQGGGFMNTTDGLSATTNASTAALGVIGQLNGYEWNEDIAYLRDLEEASGGFKATPGTPIPDLLSTATALFTLTCYGVQLQYDHRDFVEAHWLDSGGFTATLLEDQSDVEYTFYGLLALGSSL